MMMIMIMILLRYMIKAILRVLCTADNDHHRFLKVGSLSIELQRLID